MLWHLWSTKQYEQYKNLYIFLKLPSHLIHNIYYLFYLNSYKGYRHLFGLPVHGQRTWSNAKTAKRLNKQLMLFKEKKLLPFLTNTQFKPFLLLTEYINYFYKYNWRYEWLFNKYHMYKLFRTSRFVKPKFYAMHIKYKKITSFYTSFFRNKIKKKKHNKRKVKIDNKSFSIGFRFGYFVFYTKFIKIVYNLK